MHTVDEIHVRVNFFFENSWKFLLRSRNYEQILTKIPIFNDSSINSLKPGLCCNFLSFIYLKFNWVFYSIEFSCNSPQKSFFLILLRIICILLKMPEVELFSDFPWTSSHNFIDILHSKFDFLRDIVRIPLEVSS